MLKHITLCMLFTATSCIAEPAGDVEGEIQESGHIMTVTGMIEPASAGIMLPHEHLLVDFIGAEKTGPHRYDADEAFDVILPYLMQARELGVTTLVECTPSYIGKDAMLFRRLSEASGVQIMTTTGYYAAVNELFLPPHAYEETAEDLAARWISEWEHGVDGTGIRPGFIKIGLNSAPLREVEIKILKAAALTHRATGMTIGCHAPEGGAAKEALEFLLGKGISPSAFIWIHANMHPDKALHTEMAQKGAWIEFDGLAPNTLEQHLELVKKMKQQDLLHRVLLSHDAGWYSVGEPQGGDFRFFGDLITDFVPMLKNHEFTEEEIDLLIRENPAKAFTIGLRVE